MSDPFTTYVKSLRPSKPRRRKGQNALLRTLKAEAKRNEREALCQRLRDHDPRQPRPELLAAQPHEGAILPPASTLIPAGAFARPSAAIREEKDVRRFIQRCFGAEYQPGQVFQSFCPKHPDLDDRTVTLIEERGTGAVVHCQRCGYRLPVLEFLSLIQSRDRGTAHLCREIWPEKIASGAIDAGVVALVDLLVMRRTALEQGRLEYVELVAEGALQAGFGDWAAVPGACLNTVLLRDDLPDEWNGEEHVLINILRSWTGETVAVDLYTRQYMPICRHWFVHQRRPAVFAAPLWTEFCDPLRTRYTCANAADAHALELAAARQAPDVRYPIWLRCDPQPMLGDLAESSGRD